MDDRPPVQNCFTNESSQPAIYQFDRQFAAHFPTCRLKIHETGIYEGQRSVSFRGGTSLHPRIATIRRRLFLHFRRRDVSIDVSSLCRVSIPRIELRERPESDWKTLPLHSPSFSLDICNSIVRESRNLPPPPWLHDETKLTSQISRISFECYRMLLPSSSNFRTNEGSSNNGEFVEAEMRMSEVSLRVIGSFASFAREGKGNGTELRSKGIEKGAKGYKK